MVSEGKVTKGGLRTVVMVQCVGARNEENPGCSRICCGVAVKNALKIKEIDPGTEVFVLFKDVRTYGFTEDRYREARARGVHFIGYDDGNLPEVKVDGERLRISLHDRILGKGLSIGADLLVLSTAIRPNPDNEALARALKTPIGRDLYHLEAHVMSRPADSSSDSIFICGLASGPRGLGESQVQALAAACHASKILSKDHLMGRLIVATVDLLKCRGCGRCEEACEYAAVSLVIERTDSVERLVSHVDPAKCQGCGKCSVICCNKSITMKHFTTRQMKRVIEAALLEGS
jgi:heterodisulfide reductase subunit A-like polyferredoxin